MQSVASKRLTMRAEGLLRVVYFQIFVFYARSNSIFVVSTTGWIFLESELFNIKISVPRGCGERNISRSLKTQKRQVKYKNPHLH